MTKSYSTLFLGIPIPTNFLHTTNHLYQYHLNNGLLAEIDLHGVKYVGKYIGDLVDMTTLSNLQEHIVSILKTIAPEFHVNEHPLQLIPIRK